MTQEKRQAFLLPVRVAVDAEGPAEAFALVWKYLNREDADNPLADATIGTPVQLPPHIDRAISAGTYADGDAARWHDGQFQLPQAGS